MRRVVSLILCFMLVGGIAVKADDLKDAQNQLNEVQDSISDKKEELNNINKNKQKVEQDIKSLDSSMTSAADKVNKLNGSVAQMNSEIAASQKEIEKAEKEIKEQTGLFKARVRAMYMSGNTGVLEVVFNSKDFSDMITRLEYVKKIMDYDKNLLKNMEYTKKNLQSWKAEVEKKKADTLVLKQKADVEVKNLQDLTNKKKDVMKALDSDKAAFESAIAEEEAQSKNIAAMIKQIQAAQEAKRKKEEEAKKQQEANKGTSSGGGGTSTNKPNPPSGKYFRILDGNYPITSPYGERIHPIFHTKINHAGIDIGVGTGTPVHALTDGEIIYAGWMSGYGNVVMIDHGNLISLYAHNSSVNVSVGQQVKGGQVVAYSGSTGNSTGPHLHFEVRQSNGATVNPNQYYIR